MQDELTPDELDEIRGPDGRLPLHHCTRAELARVRALRAAEWSQPIGADDGDDGDRGDYYDDEHDGGRLSDADGRL